MAKVPTPAATEEELVEIDINEANHTQLLWFSREQMNLDVDTVETLNQTLSRLKGAYDHPTIKVPKVIGEAVEPIVESTLGDDVEASAVGNSYGLPAYVYVQAHGDGEDDQDTVKLAHNGKTYLIKVGSTVRLPWYVYQGCLVDSKEIRYSSGRDSGIGQPRMVQAVAFTRVR